MTERVLTSLFVTNYPALRSKSKVKVRGSKRELPKSFEQGVQLPVHGLCVSVIIADVVNQLLIYIGVDLGPLGLAARLGL